MIGLRVLALGALIAVLIPFASNSSAARLAPQSTWSKYMPKKQRVSTVRGFSKSTGLGGLMKGASMGAFLWVTDPVASAIVSDAIDDERLTPEEADARYALLRAPDVYTFIAVVIVVRGYGFFTRADTVDVPGGPFAENQLFLQLKENTQTFSRGEVHPDPISISVGGKTSKSNYIVRFPKTSRDGAPLVLDPPRKVQVQFKVDTKTAVFDYDLAEWLKDKKLKSLGDL